MKNSNHTTPHTMEMDTDSKVSISSFHTNSGQKIKAYMNHIMKTLFLSKNTKHKSISNSMQCLCPEQPQSNFI
jgi:hypothetical protein